MGWLSKKALAEMAIEAANHVPTPEGIEFDRRIVQCVVDAVAVRREALIAAGIEVVR